VALTVIARLFSWPWRTAVVASDSRPPPLRVRNEGWPKGVFAVLVVLVLLTDCTSSGSRSVVFAVGGAPTELLCWQDLIGDFASESGISVKMVRLPTDSSQQRQSLLIPLKAGLSDPDVFLMDVAWVGLFAAAKWLEPLGGKVDVSPFFPNVVKEVDIAGGQLVALPVYMDGGLLYYRKDLLKEAGLARPPETWEEMVSSAVKVQRRQRVDHPNFFGFVWTGSQYEGLVTVFMEFAGSKGGFAWKSGRIRLASPENIRALTFMRDLIWREKISPPSTYTTMKEEEVRRYFQAGDALYERNWPYAWALHQAEGSQVKDKTGVAPVPALRGSRSVSTLGGFHIGVSTYSDVKAEALEFVRFVTRYQSEKQLVLKLGWNPGRQDLYGDPAVLAVAPHLRTLREVFAHARPRPVVPYYTQISEIVQRHLNRALANEVSPEAALAHADGEIADLLARYELN
jgi:multiple sugar transport system substrate-binding protein